MGCGASAVDYRTIWKDTIRLRIPVESTASHEAIRADLFFQLDVNRSGFLTTDETPALAHYFQLDTVCTAPNILIDEAMRVSGGAHGVGRRRMAAFLGALRDAFDLFYVAQPTVNRPEKLLSSAEVGEICSEMRRWGHRVEASEAPVPQRDAVGVEFAAILPWAMRVSHGREGSSGHHVTSVSMLDSLIPIHGPPAVIRDLFLRFDRRGVRQLSRDDVQDGCSEEMQLQRIGIGAVLASMTAFDDIAVKSNDESEDGPVVLRRGFFVFLRRLYFYCATLMATKNQQKRGPVNISLAEVEEAEQVLSEDLGVTDPVGKYKEVCTRQGAESLDLVAATECIFGPQLEATRLLPNMTTPWEKYSVRFPLGPSPDDEIRRKELFAAMDASRSRSLTIDDLVHGSARQLMLDEIESDISSAVRIAVAYAEAADWTKLKGLTLAELASRADDKSVSLPQFRMYLSTLHDYYELLSFLAELDVCADGLLTRDEFGASAELLNDHIGSVSANDFDIIDRNGDGVLDSDEFLSWALQKRREADALISKSYTNIRSSVPSDTPLLNDIDIDDAVTQWRKLRETFPLSRQEAADIEQRKILFQAWDKESLQRLTWDDIEDGSRTTLQLHRIVSNPVTVIRRAFDIARTAKKRASRMDLTDSSQTTVELVEFRMYLCYLYDYCEFATSYMEALDEDPAVLTLEKFTRCVTIMGVGDCDPHTVGAMFEELDDRSRGWVPFYEFVEWSIQKGVAPSKIRSGSIVRTNTSSIQNH